MIIAHRMAAMEKRRIGTRFLDHEVTDADRQKPLAVIVQEKCESCSIMWLNKSNLYYWVLVSFVVMLPNQIIVMLSLERMFLTLLLSIGRAQLLDYRAAGEITIDSTRYQPLFDEADCNDHSVMCFRQPLNCKWHERNCLTVKLRLVLLLATVIVS